MKATKNQILVGILSILVLLGSLAVMLCDILIPLNFWSNPVLNFFFCLAVGFGLISLIIGIIKRSSWYLFIGAFLLGLALIYLLAQYIKWWIGLIIVAVLWVVIAIISFMLGANKTEFAINDSPDYKDYKTRKAKKLENEEQVEELPEIKSFK